jgi:hypothetical protein
MVSETQPTKFNIDDKVISLQFGSKGNTGIIMGRGWNDEETDEYKDYEVLLDDGRRIGLNKDELI